MPIPILTWVIVSCVLVGSGRSYDDDGKDDFVEGELRIAGLEASVNLCMPSCEVPLTVKHGFSCKKGGLVGL